MKFAKIGLIVICCAWGLTHWVPLYHHAEWLENHVTSSDHFHIVEHFVDGTIGIGFFVAVMLAFWDLRPGWLRRIVVVLLLVLMARWYWIGLPTLKGIWGWFAGLDWGIGPIFGSTRGHGTSGWLAFVLPLAALISVLWRSRAGVFLGRIVIGVISVVILFQYIEPIRLGGFQDSGSLLFLPELISCVGVGILVLPFVRATTARKIARWLLFVFGPLIPWVLVGLSEFRHNAEVEFIAYSGTMLFVWSVYAMYCISIFERREQIQATPSPSAEPVLS